MRITNASTPIPASFAFGELIKSSKFFVLLKFSARLPEPVKLSVSAPSEAWCLLRGAPKESPLEKSLSGKA